MYSYLSPVFLSSHYHDCSILSLGNYSLQHTLTNTWGRSQRDCQTLLHNNCGCCNLHAQPLEELKTMKLKSELNSITYRISQVISPKYLCMDRALNIHKKFWYQNNNSPATQTFVKRINTMHHYTFAIQNLSYFETIRSYYHNWIILSS